jgi:putative phage-type endonuclease
MATVLTLPDREAWLAERKHGLGASDWPVVLGLTKKTPFALWAEKCDLLPAEDLAASIEAVDWGLRLQGPILQGFADRTGRHVEEGHPFAIVRHEQYPFLFASLDGTQQCPDRGPGVVEAKNVGSYLADEWANDQTPLKFVVQVQAQQICADLDWGSVVGLLGGNRLLYRDFERDDSFLEAAIPHLEAFWHCVETRTPPPVDGTEFTRKVLGALHPEDNGMTIELGDEAIEWADKLEQAKQESNALKDLEELYSNRLRAAIGPNTFGVLPDGRAFSYKTQTRKAFYVEESTFRVLRKASNK